MKVETLLNYYRGPHTVPDQRLQLDFEWSSKNKAYPRRIYILRYWPGSRNFSLLLFMRHSKHMPDAGKVIEDEKSIEAFRSLLSPEQIALCTAASIKAPPGTLIYPGRRAFSGASTASLHAGNLAIHLP